MSIIQDLWNDTAGKIFIITIASYLFGYMVYGGYLYTFFDRRGNLPFSMADFSIADLITIFPTAIITFINFIPKAIIEIIKGFLIHFLLPFGIATLVRFLLNFYIAPYIKDPVLVSYLTQAGIIIWSVGYLCAIFQPLKIPRVVFIIIEIIGAIIFFSTIPNPGEAIFSAPPTSSFPQRILSYLLSFIFSLELIALPYVFGIGIAETTIKSELLIKIDRITLSQPLFPDRIKKVVLTTEAQSKSILRELWFMQKELPVISNPDIYEWGPVPGNDLYLIATFEKYALLFVPSQNSKGSRTIMINRDIILSMELSKTKERKPK